MNPRTRSGRQPLLPSPARFVVAVGSGKGGVGKSTVSLNLAIGLAESGVPVGLLDADFYGPNIPLMTGLKRDRWAGDWALARRRNGQGKPSIPAMERFGIKLMSAGFIIAEDQPMILDGQTLPFLMRQLVAEVQWGELDYLIIDLPPGTADVQQALLRLLPFSGAVLVVTPQDVAHLDGKKAVQMFRRSGVRLLGAVENMSGFSCPHCHQPIDIFHHVPIDRSVWALDVECLGTIPLDPAISQAGDHGVPAMVAHSGSEQAAAFRAIAAAVRGQLEAGEQDGES
jgi:ATP-binding protein involved in chromosome partitioning